MNDEEKRIEWDVPQPTLKEWLMVSRRVDGEPSLREHVYATPEDLRNACEAVGLHVVDRRVFDAIVAKGEEHRLESEEHRRRFSDAVDRLALVRSILDSTGVFVCDLPEIARVTIEALGSVRSEVATLRAQLDELRAEHKAMVAASLRELEVLRAQLAAAEALLEATRQASQCAPKSADIPKMVADIVANRKAVCEHARALEAQLAALASPEGRATDEDLVEIWANAFDKEQSLATHVPGSGTARLAAARAVAARVRREPGLVERLVAAKAKFSAFERESDATWTVHVCLPGTGGYTTNVTDLPSADVPATLARLAGLEVK